MSTTLTFDPTSHAYRLAGGWRVRSVTGVIRAAGLMGSLMQFGTAAALERGSAVHALCQLVDVLKLDASGLRRSRVDWPTCLPPPPLSLVAPESDLRVPRVFCPDELQGYLIAYCAWRDLYAHDWTHVETPLYRQDLNLAGTPDRVGVVRGRPALVEIKTGVHASWHGLQTAGYDLLAPIPVARDRFGLYLREDGKFKFRRLDDDADHGRFLRLLEVA